MRVLWLLIVAVLGLGMGVGQSWLADYHPQTEEFFEVTKLKVSLEGTSNKKTSAGEIHKRVGPVFEVVNGALHDFGAMRRGVTRKHTFVIKNAGTMPLEMALGRTTCKCTLSKVGKETLKPGESTEITLEWSTKEVKRNQSKFNQTATIITNDRLSPIAELRVVGQITSEYRVFPDELTMQAISGTQDSTEDFIVLHFGDIPPELVKWTFTPERYHDLIDVTAEPLTENEYKDHKGATSGLKITLKIKPGLPIGPLVVDLKMELKSEESSQVGIKVKGIVVGDIVLSGSSSRFDRTLTTLNLGNVAAADGDMERLFIFVKGPHRQETTFTIGSTVPAEQLHVEIGPPVQLGGGSTTRYEMTVRVPKGVARVNHLGNGNKFGLIVLNTTHPTTKEVHLYVRFAVR